MNITVNLPVQSVKFIVNVDDPKLEMPINDALDFFNNKNKDSRVIRSLFAEPTLIASTFRKDRNVDYKYGVSYINKIVKKPIEGASDGIKYFNVKVKYFNDKIDNFIVPGYVKFFSRTLNAFVPVENMKKSDVLVDYQHNVVQMLKKFEYGQEDTEPVPDITEFYSIKLSCEKAEMLIPFYYNGILSHVYFNDYQKNISTTEA